MECASVSLSLSVAPRSARYCLVFFPRSCLLLSTVLLWTVSKRGEKKDSLLCIRRQWHGPPHSSYLHSFNATWGPVECPPTSRLTKAGPTVPLIPVPLCRIELFAAARYVAYCRDDSVKRQLSRSSKSYQGQQLSTKLFPMQFFNQVPKDL